MDCQEVVCKICWLWLCKAEEVFREGVCGRRPLGLAGLSLVKWRVLTEVLFAHLFTHTDCASMAAGKGG